MRGFTSRLQRYLAGSGDMDLPSVVTHFCAEIVRVREDVHGNDLGDALCLNST